MSDGVRWESPPTTALGDGTKRGRPAKHADTRAALITATGSWARIEDHLTLSAAQTLASRINHGQRQWAGHDWSARYDVAPAGEGWSVWVRHNQPNP